MKTLFDGITYNEAYDFDRLNSLLARVQRLMRDGRWRSLEDICSICGGTEASVSARLRDLRKERFGAHTIERRRVAPPERGRWVYRMTT